MWKARQKIRQSAGCGFRLLPQKIGKVCHGQLGFTQNGAEISTRKQCHRLRWLDQQTSFHVGQRLPVISHFGPYRSANHQGLARLWVQTQRFVQVGQSLPKFLPLQGGPGTRQEHQDVERVEGR